MQINYHGKNVSITDGMKHHVNSKLSFLNKYHILSEDAQIRVVVKIYNTKQKVEITGNIPSYGVLRAEAYGQDFYAAVDMVVDKLEDQIRKHKTLLEKRHKRSLSENSAYQTLLEENNETLVKTKQIEAENMSLDEAISCMELLDHSFFVYTDDETEKVAIVYKRLNGGYGLIEVK